MATLFRLSVGKLYMPEELARRLRATIDRELPNLRAIPAESTARSPKPGKWSQREELGHLIDSATNNHVRFALASIDGEFRAPGYAQDDWVRIHAYNQASWGELVDVWYHDNSLLSHLIRNIVDEDMDNRCVIGSKEFTLGFIMADYIVHMQHHLDHIMAR